MRGMILNVHDERLPQGSVWRTREEDRHQEPVFRLEDGYPVFEVWYWFDELGRWFVMSRTYDARLAGAGVVYYFGVEQLKAWIFYLTEQQRSA